MTVASKLEVAHSSPDISAAERAAVDNVLRSALISQGVAAAQFAVSLQAHEHASAVALTSSGTAAIALAIDALDVHAGDEVVLPSYVCASVREAVCLSGAKPVLCDLGDRWLMTAETVQAVMTIRTRAIIAVDTFGLAADLRAIGSLGVPVIDDRCQAFGLPQEHGGHAAFSVCSFHATKCLTAGEGGAVLSWNTPRADMLDMAARRHRRTLCAFSDIHATVAQQQLERWRTMLARRREIASRYVDALPVERTAWLPNADSTETVWFRFPVLLRDGENFDAMRAQFSMQGVQVRRGVDALLHRAAGLPDSQFPATTRAFERTLSLPLWPAMTDDMVDHVLYTAIDVLGS